MQSVTLKTWAQYCGVVCFLSPSVSFLHTHKHTHTRPKKTPTQRQTMDNGDPFRLGETNCGQVRDCIWGSTEQLHLTTKSAMDSRERHKCFVESDSTSTRHIQEVLTDASEERSLWLEEPHSAQTVSGTVRLWDVSENIESSYK